MVLGREIALRIDQTLIQDATGTMVWQEFGSFGIPRVHTRVCVTYVDHNTLQTGYENADDHLYLQSMAAKYGAVFSRPGNGISHFAHLERFDVPGETMLGADSHTRTAGAMAMLAIGAGGAEVAAAMVGEPFYVIDPADCDTIQQGDRLEMTHALSPRQVAMLLAGGLTRFLQRKWGVQQ